MSDQTGGLPDLHDWELVELSVDRVNKQVEFGFLLPEEGRRFTLKCIEVKALYLGEVRMQNVVLDSMLFVEKNDSSYFKRCCEILDLGLDALEKNKGYKILYLEPSFGAEVACLFAEMESL